MKETGTVYTFYSYKGGVGRSMAVANVAALLSKWGKRVLIVDWDLEAPGIERYFLNTPSRLIGSRKEIPGLVDIVHAYAGGEPIHWSKCLLRAYPSGSGPLVNILTAGQETADYTRRLNALRWEALFAERGLGAYLEELRGEWKAAFDFVLIDSRTGITDIGGICTIHMPDALVLLFTTNRQSLDGVIEVMKQARSAHSLLPYDRSHLVGVPVAARDESRTEYKQALRWRSVFAQELSEVYADWLPPSSTAAEVLERLRIPYVPYWSFGERLPVAEEGTTDPSSLGSAYEMVARLIASHLKWEDAIRGEFLVPKELETGVVAEAAEAVFQALTPSEAILARRLFARLVRVAQPEDDTRDTPRRLPISELDATAQPLIERFTSAGVLITGSEDKTADTTVEIAHENLIQGWDRLRTWIDDDREFLLWRQHLGVYLSNWQRSGGGEGTLLRGEPLAEAERWALLKPDDLSGQEKQFIAESSEAQRYSGVKATQIFPARTRRLRWAAIGAAAVILLAFAGSLTINKTPGVASAGPVAIIVQTEPAGAAISINGEHLGVSNLALNLRPGDYRMEARREGYQLRVAAVQVAAPSAPDQPAPRVNLTLQPLPQRLIVHGDQDLEVILDGSRSGQMQDGQFVLDGLAAGVRSLELAGRAGQRAAVLFEVIPGSAPVLRRPIEAKDLRTVVVSNLGNSARVYSGAGKENVVVDGSLAGVTTPNGLELTKLAPGVHMLKLGEGRNEQSITFEAGVSPAVTVFFTSDRNVGSLVVLTGEDGANVFLNGQARSNTTRRGQFRTVLPAGSYTVRVERAGYRNQPEQRVTIEKGQEAKLTFSLQPLPSVSSLAIRSALPGTQVLLDGVSLGTVGADGTFDHSGVSPGEHVVLLRKDRYSPKQVASKFSAGETVVLAGSEIALASSTGILRLLLVPRDSRVTISRAGEPPRAVTETIVEIVEGTYTISALAPGYLDRVAVVSVKAGESKVVDMTLSRVVEQAKSAPSPGGMSAWETRGWIPEGGWFVHRGGNFVLYGVMPVAGTISFTARVDRGQRLRWFVNRVDDRNYAEFQLDSSAFYRNLVTDGRERELKKTSHRSNKSYSTLQIDVRPGRLIHKIYDGQRSVVLDDWEEAGRDFTKGKFGFLIPGRDEVAIANFTFSAR